MISCADAVRQLWEYLERVLPAADAARMEEHLGVCMRCCGEVEFAHELRGFLHTNAEIELPPGVSDRLEGFLDALEQSGDAEARR